jgi:predicted PurR-regulated permease PerM
MPDDPTSADSGASQLGDPTTWRGRVGRAAERRGIPLGSITVTVLVVVAIVDLNALLVLLLWVLRRLILFLLVAGFIAVLLRPPVRGLERRGIRRGLASSIVVLIALVVFGGIVALFTAPVVSGINHLSRELPALLRQARSGHGWLGHLVTRFHLQRFVDQNLPKVASTVERSLKPAQALSVGAAAVSTVIALTTIAILSFFLLLEGPSIGRGILGVMRPEQAERASRVYREASRSVSGYMVGNALTSLVAGVVVFATLSVLHVPFALLLGVWVALVDLLPLVGGLLAGIPVVFVALLHSVGAAVVMLIVFVLYQLFENHVLNPVIMSRTVRLNPLWVLLAVLVGATLGAKVGAGLGAFVGALLGIPMGGAIQVVAREIRRGPGAGASDTGPSETGDPDGGTDPGGTDTGTMGAGGTTVAGGSRR